MKNKKRCRNLGPMLLLMSCLLAAPLPALAEDTAARSIDYEAGFYYTVKQGDTLWDLSQRFSDTPWQWPDLWRENRQLPNPHWIYPGERIRLFRKTGQHQFAETAAAVEPPSVLPQASAAPVREDKPLVEFTFANMDQVGFIRKPAVKPLGSIFKSLNEKELISKDDVVYIRYADSKSADSFAPGTRLSVYRTLLPTEDPKSDRRIGTQHLLTGLAEVTKKEAKYAVAQVTKNYRAILLNDLVMPYEPRKSNIPVVESTPGIEGQILSSENHTKLIGNFYTAFIDKGTEDKILPGQIYHIYKTGSAPIGTFGRMVDLEQVYTGSILVLLTEQKTSTVVVTDNVQNITPGDRFKTP